jgi:hypothetical protein
MALYKAANSFKHHLQIFKNEGSAMHFYAILLAAMIFSTSAQAQLLWRDLPAGATIDQVKQKLPNASVPTSTSGSSDGQTKSSLEYSGFQLADMDFKATLYFIRGKLDHVSLDPIVRPRGQAAVVANLKLRDSLVAKYGPPDKEDKPRSSLVVSEDADWVKDGTLIELRFRQYGSEGEGFLSVQYRAPQDTSNL